ncbi:hypothetical protein [Croceimicrobium hydrocarbonivorans]|uniref:Uncharacterized protein n=1 Tax=Croceimicrobium hydrocarbonivorans TaxID=2761580 RepID=A0A7H0VJN7_9FLAO|nr:hypothetical protein [Croceimicrobium hydrocarbonivorans]QNR25935.1 hypothetical protein H4K34_08845 [Croceimicrobium hydrocarbonivorans]
MKSIKFLFCFFLSLALHGQSKGIFGKELKGPSCSVSFTDSTRIYLITEGGFRYEPKTLNCSFEGHSSDSLYGFINTKDFRRVVDHWGPMAYIVIYGLGEDFKTKGKLIYREDPTIKEVVAYYIQGSGELIIYRPQL